MTLIYTRLVTLAEQVEFYERYLKPNNNDSLFAPPRDDQAVYVVVCIIRGERLGGTVAIKAGQTLEQECAREFANWFTE